VRVWNSFAVRTALLGTPLARRFRWRNAAVLAERILCTSWADLQRYRTAKNIALPLDVRQHQMVSTVVSPGFVDKLVKARRFKTPLSLRNSIWSAHQPVNETHALGG
jgi:hypothetical protein